MTDATFEKLDASEQPLYGPRRLILCGFDAAARKDFEKLIRIAEIDDLDRLWANGKDAERRLKALFEKKIAPSEAPPSAQDPDHPRAIIAGGLQQKEFHLLMNLSREVGMPPTLWAVLTPVSEAWTLKALLNELTAERTAMTARRRQRPE